MMPIRTGIHPYRSYRWRTVYPKNEMTKAIMAVITIPTFTLTSLLIAESV